MPDNPSMTVCLDCQRSTSGACWRHQNATFINFVPAPEPSSEPQISGIPISKFGTHDKLVAEIERLREAIRKHFSAYMAGDDLVPTLNALAEAAGLKQQGEG